MRTASVAAAVLLALAAPRAGALTIAFDYSRDTSNFFADPARRNLLNLAATSFNGFSDSLSAITPSGDDTWTAYLADPATGGISTISNPTIPANTLVVYVGARDLPGSTLGLGGPGGYDYSASTQAFADAVDTRGQAGDTGDPATSTDFGRWGGSIAFDSNTSWFFGTSVTGLGSSQADFLSVAIHELGHVLGFGTSPSFQHYYSGNNFVGPASKAKNGGAPVPLLPTTNGTDGRDHWAEGTASKINGLRAQETAMDPTLTLGTRKIFTDLDYAGLADVGWQVRIPGDANADGRITADDYALIDRGLAKHLTGWSNGDFNADGTINAADYLIIDREFANQTGTFDPGLLLDREARFGPAYAVELAAFIPEPAALGFLAAPAALGLIRRQRRR